ncbi:hypothetical protein Lokhon_01690 [Limimaricola hongkongensis DSM 17492]|uniref:Uncharacterized protein n=1 Tax=Limimaricola hongkongensis DSM 17492 TaxID=1122180 RepID=A0A017HBX0_9RHOB|nr:hypothetical protein Lokhon_01690 [Limimaricola hongkongensis DSM 17492]
MSIIARGAKSAKRRHTLNCPVQNTAGRVSAQLAFCRRDMGSRAGGPRGRGGSCPFGRLHDKTGAIRHGAAARCDPESTPAVRHETTRRRGATRRGDEA